MAAQPYTGKDGSAGRVVKGCRGFVWRVDRLCCTPVRRSLEENREEGKKKERRKKRKPGRRKKEIYCTACTAGTPNRLQPKLAPYGPVAEKTYLARRPIGL